MENKQNIKDLIQKFYPHAKEKLGFEHPVRVIMRQDAENAQQSLGKTAYYDPAEKLIVLYVTNRHPKDVLRSFSHELVHHAQNCRGELDDLSTDAHYAKDGKGREIEEEAYLQGNLNLRDYEDSIKFKGVNEMKLTKSQLKSFIESTVNAIMIEGAKADKDYDGDGKIETSEEEYLGSRDKAIKKAMAEEQDVDEMHCGGNRDDELEEQEKKIAGRKTFKVAPEGPGSKEQADLDAKTAASGDEDTGKFLKRQIAKTLKPKPSTAPTTIVKPSGKKLEENNNTWYNLSLYESLKSKWTK